ncbi:hypothetical protein K525DRAFT_362515 [Schizophyllum commune Loenen D]|nr:hypothetical protein K525DRAFT_362515 [Schizophyllum commune Loenen D]
MADEQSGYEAALDSLPSSILGSIADLDLRKIRALEQKTRLVMAAVKSARNAHALILERIFLLVQPSYDDFLPKWPGLKSLERWRLISTSYPALWTILDLCHDWSADAARTSLARSGNASLTVFFSTKDMGVLEEVLDNHRDRLAVLHVATDGVSAFNEVCEFYLALPDCAVCRFLSASLLETTMTSDVDELLKIVGASPHLEELVCLEPVDWSRRAANDDPSSLPTFHLPQLRYLQLWTPHSMERNPLLYRLEIPESCDVRLHLPVQDPLTTLLPSASRFRPLQRPVHAVQLCSGGLLSCWVVLYSGYIAVEGYCDYSQFACITDINTKLVVQLDDLTDRTSPEGWSRLLASMPKIRTLVIYGRGEARGLKGLFAVLSSQPEGAESLLWPDLVALHLCSDHADAGAAFAIWQLSALRAQEGKPLREVLVYSDGEKGHLGRRQSSDGTRHTLILDATGWPTQVATRALKCNLVKFGEIIARQA